MISLSCSYPQGRALLYSSNTCVDIFRPFDTLYLCLKHTLSERWPTKNNCNLPLLNIKKVTHKEIRLIYLYILWNISFGVCLLFLTNLLCKQKLPLR